MKHKVFKEKLYHYKCDKCERWWSIADMSKSMKAHIKQNGAHCPYCGHQAYVEKHGA